MNYETIRYEVEDGAAILTLVRPDKMNAVNGAMIREIIDVCDHVDRDDDVDRNGRNRRLASHVAAGTSIHWGRDVRVVGIACIPCGFTGVAATSITYIGDAAHVATDLIGGAISTAAARACRQLITATAGDGEQACEHSEERDPGGRVGGCTLHTSSIHGGQRGTAIAT